MLKAAGYNFVSYASAQDFLDKLDGVNAKCLLIDLRMPGMNGLELQKALADKKVYIPIILITAHADVPVAVQAVKAGAYDVLEKPFTEDVLVDRIERAFRLYEQWNRIEGERKKIAERLIKLTPRELEVLDQMVAGKKNKMIAQDLGISPKTLDIHRSKVMDKMEARTVADLVRWRVLEKMPPTMGTIVDA